MLECLLQTKLKVLYEKELSVLLNQYREYIHLEANISFISIDMKQINQQCYCEDWYPTKTFTISSKIKFENSSIT